MTSVYNYSSFKRLSKPHGEQHCIYETKNNRFKYLTATEAKEANLSSNSKVSSWHVAYSLIQFVTTHFFKNDEIRTLKTKIIPNIADNAPPGFFSNIGSRLGFKTTNELLRDASIWLGETEEEFLHQSAYTPSLHLEKAYEQLPDWIKQEASSCIKFIEIEKGQCFAAHYFDSLSKIPPGKIAFFAVAKTDPSEYCFHLVVSQKGAQWHYRGELFNGNLFFTEFNESPFSSLKELKNAIQLIHDCDSFYTFTQVDDTQAL